MSISERLLALRRRGVAYFEQALPDFQNWQSLDERLKEECRQIAAEYAGLARTIGPVIRRSPLLTDIDEREFGRAFKAVRAALRFRRYHRDRRRG